MSLDFYGNRPMFGNRAGEGAVVDQDRYLFWASGARVPSGANVVAQSSANYILTKKIFGSPQYAINNFRLHYSGFACTESGASPQETVLPGNDVVIDGVWIEVGGVVTRCKFAGADGVTIASGSTGAWTDDLALAVAAPADGFVTIYTLYHTAVGQNQIPVYDIQDNRGERGWVASDAATLLPLVGSTSASTGPTATTLFYGPDFMVAKGWDGRDVALVVNDSIGERQNDSRIFGADARGNLGWLRRWLDKADPTYGRMPHFLMGVPGASSDRELAANSTKRWDVLDEIVAFNGGKRPFTVLLDQMSRNNYNASVVTMVATSKGLIDRIRVRHPGTKVIGIGGMVHPASTDGFRTLANQSYQVGGDWPNGVRYQYEAAREALLDGYYARFVETIRACGYDVLLGKWPVPAFVTSLAADTGSSYSNVTLVDKPNVGDFLHFNATTAPLLANVKDVTGSAGAWVCTLDRTLTTAFLAGGEVYAPASNDGTGNPRQGTHPRPREIIRIVNTVPQSGKAKLA